MTRSLLAFASLLAVFVAGCADDIAHGNRIPQPDPPKRWEVVASEPGHCSCPQGRQFFLVNRQARRDSIVITEVRNDILGDTSYAQAAFPDVEPGTTGRKFLKCSPETVGNTQCNVEYQWVVDGVVFNQNSRLLTPQFESTSKQKEVSSAAGSVKARAASSLAAILHGQGAAGRKDCLAVCRSGSKECLRVSMAGAGADPTAEFVRLVRAQGSQGQVPVTELLAALKQTSNPCERSDLTVSNGLVSNTGYACQWTAGEGTPLEVQARIPDTLAGQLSFPGDQLKAVFPKAEVFGPSLHFRDAATDAQFGGTIYSLEETSFLAAGKMRRFLVAAGSAGCVALNAE